MHTASIRAALRGRATVVISMLMQLSSGACVNLYLGDNRCRITPVELPFNRLDLASIADCFIMHGEFLDAVSQVDLCMEHIRLV